MEETREWHPAVEEYCEAIFELKEDNLKVIKARIAERLSVTGAAVTQIVKRLEKEDIAYIQEGRINLTPKGEAIAQKVVRRHRLAERFLTDILHLSWSEAHHEAGKWEHIISERVEEAMSKVLGDPTTCPHGNPIPGSDYVEPETRQLSELEIDTDFLISRIPEELEFVPDLLEFLEGADLIPGTKGKLVNNSPDGTCTVQIGNNQVGVGPFAAERILVIQSA